MKWSMDTHKYMSEITRKALQIIGKHGITSESDNEKIAAVERELAEQQVYRDFGSASGRIRRALFTYFKSYGCLGPDEKFTEIGKAFADGKISLKEFSFSYLLNYRYQENQTSYYPMHFLLYCIKCMYDINRNEAYITPFIFSKIVDCNSLEDLDSDFISDCISSHKKSYDINERTIGYDVWSKMITQAGILVKGSDHCLCVKNYELLCWIIDAYDKGITVEKGKINTGVLQYVPRLMLINPNDMITQFSEEGKAVQAFLFDSINDCIIRKYIYNSTDFRYEEMCSALGLHNENRGFYKIFSGLEHLIAYSLIEDKNSYVKAIGKIILSQEVNIEDEADYKVNGFIEFSNNILLYGVPGCGKSYSVDKFIKDEGIPKSFVRRVVFHPDYTYSDFVGQIMPVTKETVEGKKIEYTFVPGPFTDILKIAYENPKQKCALIIEELNRGNAPAIFGDLFQLLDREEDSSKEDYQWSKYHVTNKDIAENAIFERDDSDYSVKLPPNLAILATMNTSDQNVFSMDTAFQRRWQMQHIRNEFKGEHADKFIEGTRITWKAFATTVNELLTEKSNVFGNSEDKCLGAYFAIDAELDNRQRFAEKVLKYLWDDAFKMDGTPLFDKQYTSLSKLIEDFEDATGDALKIVLNNEVYNKMLEKSETMQAQAEDIEADEVTDQE